MEERKKKKAVIIIALITAICVLGDAMLYIVLPIYWEEFGLTSIWQVGVLLAVNRFIRLPLNPFVGWCYQRMSKRTGVLISVCLAILTTLSYGWLQGFWLLVLMRCLWGVAWSFLRLGGFLTVIESSTDQTRGRFIGLYNGLWGLGGLVGMLIGGLLADLINIQTAATLFGLLALGTIPFVWRYIPPGVTHAETNNANGTERNLRVWKERPVWLALGTGIVMALIIFGVFAATISRLIEHHLAGALVLGLGAAALAGVLQAVRWSWDPFLAPYVGRLSDSKIGRQPFIILSFLGAGLFLYLLTLNLPVFTLILLVLLFQSASTIMVTMTDAFASDTASRTSKVKVMTGYTVAVDVGAALGALLAYLVIEWLGILVLYGMISFLAFCTGALWLLFTMTRKVELDSKSSG